MNIFELFFCKHKQNRCDYDDQVLKKILQMERKIMAKIDELLSAVNDLQQVDSLVIAKIAELNQKVQELTDALANAGNVDPQIEAATAAVVEEVNKLTTAVNS